MGTQYEAKDGVVFDVPHFAQLSSGVDQLPGVTTPVVITYDTQGAIQGLIHSTSVDPGEIEVAEDGLYSIIAQPQIGKDSGGTALMFDMFMQLDSGSGFADEPNTNIKETVKDPDITDVVVLAMHIVLNAGDKIRFMQRVSATGVGMGLKFTASEVGPPTVPATPSIIFTMARNAGGR